MPGPVWVGEMKSVDKAGGWFTRGSRNGVCQSRSWVSGSCCWGRGLEPSMGEESRRKNMKNSVKVSRLEEGLVTREAEVWVHVWRNQSIGSLCEVVIQRKAELGSRGVTSRFQLSGWTWGQPRK